MVRSITTKTNTEPVEIDGITFHVRQIGVRQQLRLIELNKIITAGESDLAAEISELYEIFESLFTDVNDGKDVKSLFDRLNPYELADLITQIFTQEESAPKEEDGSSSKTSST